MGRRLAKAIVLAHPKTGIVQSFVPGSEVPEWVAEKVTNESVWAKDEPTAEDAPDPEGDEPEPTAEAEQGVEGQAARQQRVSVANHLGSGVLENTALLPYLDRARLESLLMIAQRARFSNRTCTRREREETLWFTRAAYTAIRARLPKLKRLLFLWRFPAV